MCSASAARAAILTLPPPEGPRPPWTERLTVLIKAFERPCCVARAVVSARTRFPWVEVLVCDDSRAPLFGEGERPCAGVSWFTLPFEAGHTLGAGRNALLARCPTPWFFLMDDDQVVVDGTRLPEMLAAAEAHGLDVVAGAQGRWEYGTAVFERRGDLIAQRFHRHHGVIAPRLVRCDRTSNTFVGRTAAVRAVGWQAQVYANEHADFFLRAKAQGLVVAQMGGTHVGHDRRCEATPGGWRGAWSALRSHPDALYRRLRLGGSEQIAAEGYRRHVLDAHGVRAIVDEGRLRDRIALLRVLGRP